MRSPHLCRAALEEQQAEHERQLAAVMAKQALLLEAQEAEEAAAARQHEAAEAQLNLQQEQAAAASPSPHKQRLLQHLEERHAADVARVLTGSIFAAVLVRWQHQDTASAAGQPGAQVLSPGPELHLPPSEHWLHDISGPSTARTERNPCPLGSNSGGAGSSSPSGSARRRLLAEMGAAAAAGAAAGAAAAADGPSSTPAVGRGELSIAAEAGGWPEHPGLGPSRAVAAAAAAEAAHAEVARLEGELEEAAAECERCGGVEGCEGCNDCADVPHLAHLLAVCARCLPARLACSPSDISTSPCHLIIIPSMCILPLQARRGAEGVPGNGGGAAGVCRGAEARAGGGAAWVLGRGSMALRPGVLLPLWAGGVAMLAKRMLGLPLLLVPPPPPRQLTVCPACYPSHPSPRHAGAA